MENQLTIKPTEAIDNFDLILDALEFNSENEFYFMQIIQRKKDHKELGTKLGPNNNNRTIKTYYIYNKEYLADRKEEIISLCKLFNARAYISLNRRNNYDIALEMLSNVALNIKNGHLKQLSNVYDTSCGQHHSESKKLWVIDIDEKDMTIVNKISNFINTLQPYDNKNKIKLTVPTKSGYHLITYAFNSKEFKDVYPEIDIHTNNPSILYV